MNRTALMAAAGALLLAGCQDPNAPRNTVGGALIGTGTGAALGAIIADDSRKGALIGAGIGLLAGTAAGAYMDQQEQALRRDLAGTGATVTGDGNRVVVILPGNITFDTDSSEINPGFHRTLDQVANTLQQYPKSFIDVVGHTDAQGSDAYNQDLSERRAEAVACYFRNRGVFPGRIAAFGMGESEPVATNATPEGRQQNRRVELVIIPAQDQ